MYEYGIRNIKTNERDIIFGRGIDDAYRRNKHLDRTDWEVEYREYVD